VALYSRPRTTRLLVVSLVMLSLLTITVDYRGGASGPFEAAGRGALAVVATLQSGVSKALHPIGAFVSGLAHIGSLKSENDRLRDEVQRLQQQNAKNTSLERQNEQFQNLLHMRSQLGLKTRAATVVGYSPGNFEWTVTLNVGTSDGIARGMPVVNGDGLVGHVINVTASASTVQLIIDPDSDVAGRLASSGDTGLVAGRRQKPLVMQLVSSDAKVFLGEPVVTAGYQGGLYPPEIPIGVVSLVYQQQGGLNKTVEITPSVDFSALEAVLVVTGR
jgi:rod shape-determining protein MreC